MRVSMANHNMVVGSNLLPDIKVTIQNVEWVIDLAFAMDYRVEEAFQDKINKYTNNYRGCVIPLIFQYNGMIYEKSRDLIQRIIPDFDLAELQRDLFIIIA